MKDYFVERYFMVEESIYNTLWHALLNITVIFTFTRVSKYAPLNTDIIEIWTPLNNVRKSTASL